MKKLNWIGTNCRDGRDGRPGLDGDNGISWVDSKGISHKGHGENGTNGSPGTDGQDGKPGKSVTGDLVIDFRIKIRNSNIIQYPDQFDFSDNFFTITE